MDPDEEPTDRSRRIVVGQAEPAVSLAQHLTSTLSRWGWRTPIHDLRLRGRPALRLAAVPTEPVAGDPEAGWAVLEGQFVHDGETLAVADVDLLRPTVSPAMAAALHGFNWLRDVAAAASHEDAGPIVEYIVRRWLDAQATTVTPPAWAPAVCGQRVIAWTFHAPHLLAAGSAGYRTRALNALVRSARHLDKVADRAAPGVERVTAWAGALVGALLVEGAGRPARASAGLARALVGAMHADGGLISRAPAEQVDLVAVLARVEAAHVAVGAPMADAIGDAIVRAAPALAGVVLGDGALSSWQSGRPITAERIAVVIAGSGVRARALAAPHDWGYQRLVAGSLVAVVDAAPPPMAGPSARGAASTLAFELSDGPERLVVNCGSGLVGAPEMAAMLRSTAAHSTLVLADSNSTAILPDGHLGRGVGQVAVDRDEGEDQVRLDLSHDGYRRRFGYDHRRRLIMAADGSGLEGRDEVVPVPGRSHRAGTVAVRFHLAPGVDATPTVDGHGVLLRTAGGRAWQFRCTGADVSIDSSLWVDAAGRPRATRQIVAEAAVDGAELAIGWSLRRAG